MANVLIYYASKHGQTRSIAEAMARQIRASGHRATPVDIRSDRRAKVPGEADGVIVGSCVHGGRHSRSMESFVRRNHQVLGRLPNAFFSVSMAAASENDANRKEAQGYVERFVRATEWKPQRVSTFGGALSYTRYNFLLRFIMKRISKSTGNTTDTSKDHVYTDWTQVHRFVVEFLGALSAVRPAEEGAASRP